MQSNNTVVYAGVDVAKATLQLHLQGQQSEFNNTPKGNAHKLNRLDRDDFMLGGAILIAGSR